MFLNGADEDDVRSIVTLLSEKAKQHKDQGFKAFVYFLDGSPDQLKKLNKELKADSIALALIPDDDLEETLELYEVNKKAKSTVFVYNKRLVTEKIVNFDDEKNSEQVQKAIDEICQP